jgi:outer membrane protein assembly factor BamB
LLSVTIKKLYYHVQLDYIIEKIEDVMRKQLHIIFSVWLLLITVSLAAVQSQWRGPQRSGHYPDAPLLTSWPAQGPTQLWQVKGLGQGFSSPAVTSNMIFVSGMVNQQGQISAFDPAGKLIWKTTYGPEWTASYPGSRCTPTVVDDRLYIESAMGTVFCLDAKKGTILWSVDLVKTYGAEVLEWGMVENLLIDGDRLICTPGGKKYSVIALNRANGQFLWGSASVNEKAGYCSPLLAQHGKRRLIITMTAQHIIGVDADTGKLLWQHTHITDYDINPNTPFYQDGCIYAVSGYGSGGVKLQLSADGASITELWQDKTLDAQIGATVFVDGFIYGAGHNKNKWHCLDFSNGQIKYSSNLLARGTSIFADGMLYCYTERGDVALVKPDPTAFKVISSFRITEGTDQHWAHPVIADKKLFVRHGDALLVFNIAR